MPQTHRRVGCAPERRPLPAHSETVLHAPRPLDYSPVAVFAGAGDVVAGFHAAAFALRSLAGPGHESAGDAAFGVVCSYGDAFGDAVASSAPGAGAGRVRDAGWVVRWVASVRDCAIALSDAYWASCRGADGSAPAAYRLRLASSAAEVVKWSACSRSRPPLDVWGRLAVLFTDAPESYGRLVGGDLPGIGREYLRAIAYHSAGLDQMVLDTALAACALIDRALPFIELSRKKSLPLQYVVSPPDAPMPERRAGEPSSGAWHFQADAAGELLRGFREALERGEVPAALAGQPLPALHDAVEALLRRWSADPPIRLRRRFPQEAEIDVTHGFENCLAVLDERASISRQRCRTLDFSHSGLHFSMDLEPPGGWPDIGGLVAVHFVDGQGWQLGVVRRLGFGQPLTDLGIELIARKPQAADLDDGRSPVRCILCDEVLKGELVRVVLPSDCEFVSERVFLRSVAGLFTLRKLQQELVERDYRICTFQVL